MILTKNKTNNQSIYPLSMLIPSFCTGNSIYIYIYIVYIYIYIYIYCHPPTDCFVVSQLFSVVWCFKLGSETSWLYVSQLSYSKTIVILCVTEGIFTYIFTYTSSATGSTQFLIHIYENIWTYMDALYAHTYIDAYIHGRLRRCKG